MSSHLAYPPAVQTAYSGLHLTTRFNPLQWMLFFQRPIVTINGQSRHFPWGLARIPLAPGQYELDLHVWNLLGKAFKASQTVVVYPGYETGMEYSTASAFFTFQSGSLRTLGYRPCQ